MASATNRRAVGTVVVACILTWTGSAPAQCKGDFNHDGFVTVDELITAVESALNGCQVSGERFVDNGDGTVTDERTGLIWERKDNLDGSADQANPHDADNRYSWSVSTDSETADGTAFTDFLSQLNACVSVDGSTVTGGFAGYCDWRLPTIYELQTIVDLSDPRCDQTEDSPCIFPALRPSANAGYWSSTTHAPGSSNVWGVLFNQGGRAYSFGKAGSNRIRAVRRGS